MAEHRIQTPWAVVLLAATSALLAWQMFAFISEHGVNILFWDLWDIYPVLFSESSWWEIVRVRSGVHRQGPGFLLTKLVADATSMNTRAESFAIAGVFCGALAAAIGLARAVIGKFRYTDSILPLIVLTSVQQDTWVGVPNLSVGAAPLLLILLLCVAWIIPGNGLQACAVIGVNLMLVNSGYGLVAAPLAPGLFAVGLFHAVHQGDSRRAAWAGAGLAGSLGAIALLLYGWSPGFNSACAAAGSADQMMLPGFVVLMLAKFVGLDFDHFGLFSTVFGTVLFFAMLEVLVRRGKRVLRHEDRNPTADRVVFTLVGFSMLYAFLTAYGRICESLLVSQSSRYMTLLIPGFVGLYLDLLTRPAFRWRRAALGIFLAAALFGSVSVWLVTDDGAARIRDSKLRWKECYLRVEDVGRCDAEARAQVYPWDPAVNLPPRLEYLKENRLNLYSER